MSVGAWPEAETRGRWWALAGVVALLALLASFNGLKNDFTYDDRFIVVTNDLVHNVRRAWTLFLLPYWPMRLGGDGYRPLVLVAFSVQWALAPGSSTLFHAVNVLLYVAGSIAVFRLASLLMPNPYAWLAAALFAVHPVHVEATASVVGQSELWVGLILTSAATLYISTRRADQFTTGRQLSVAGLYFAGCLFKEHAVMLPALLLSAEWLLVDGRESFARRVRSLRPFYLALLLLACFYLAFRSLVIHKEGAGFVPFIAFISLKVTTLGRMLTMIGLIPQWARLLLWPASLAPEYAPPQYPIATGFDLYQLPGALILIGVLVLTFWTARRAPVVAFGIGWMILTLLPSSNFVLPTGILIAERTLFMPSLGPILAVCAVLPVVVAAATSSVSRFALLIGTQTLLLAGVVKSIEQSAIWRDNLTLFTSAVAIHPDVYRTHYILGAWMMARRDYAVGEHEYLAAMRLFPHDPFVAYNMGQEYFQAQLYDQAFRMYARSNEIVPEFQDATARMALCRAVQGRYAEARRLALAAIREGDGDLGMLHSVIVAANLDDRARQRLSGRIMAKPAPVVAR